MPPELADAVGWLLARAGQLVGGALTAALAGLEVSPRELSVLVAAAPRPRPQLGLAVAIGLDKTTMVATVDALEGRGLVRREQHPADRRMRLVVVTEAGAALAERAREAADRTEAELLGALSPGQAEQLRELLRTVIEAAADRPAGGSCV